VILCLDHRNFALNGDTRTSFFALSRQSFPSLRGITQLPQAPMDYLVTSSFESWCGLKRIQKGVGYVLSRHQLFRELVRIETQQLRRILCSTKGHQLFRELVRIETPSSSCATPSAPSPALSRAGAD
jgi:hypothetical protein